MQTRGSILIVEDDPFIAMDIADDLSGRGFEIIAAVPDVSTAQSVLLHKKPDFAILDFNLGNETSAPIASKLTDLEVPFVFVTGNPTAVEKLNGISAPILNKPIDMDVVLEQFAA